ncbi:MAG: chemotaxis protein CheW [Myxococcales bacterium]
MTDLASQLESLARAFDERFAAPQQSPSQAVVDLLEVRCASERLALETGRLLLVEPARRVIAVPGAPASCSGVAGVRGKLVAVYPLLSSCRPGQTPSGVLLLTRLDPSLAFFVDAVERYSRVESDRISVLPAGPDEPSRAIAKLASGPVPLVSVDDLVRKILSAAGGEHA